MYDETKGGSAYEEMYSAHIMSCIDDRDCGLWTEQAGGAPTGDGTKKESSTENESADAGTEANTEGGELSGTLSILG